MSRTFDELWDAPSQTHYNNVDCPYCGDNQQADSEDWPWREDEEETMHCYSCGKDFTVLLHNVEFTWKILKQDEEDPQTSEQSNTN